MKTRYIIFVNYANKAYVRQAATEIHLTPVKNDATVFELVDVFPVIDELLNDQRRLQDAGVEKQRSITIEPVKSHI